MAYAEKMRATGSSSGSSHSMDQTYLYSPTLEAQQPARPRWRLLLLLVGLIVLVDLSLDLLKGNSSAIMERAPAFIQRYTAGSSELSESFPQKDDFCDICDCHKNPPTLNKAMSYALLPPSQRSQLPHYLRSHILDIQCKHTYAQRYAALGMVRHTTTDPRRMMAWDVTRLKEGVPTAFIFTKTTPAGKTGPQRSGYVQRHIEMFQEHQRVIQARGQWFDGQSVDSRQLIWIIVEDMDRIDDELVMVLTQSKINFLYFAFGPTRSYGNAQHNAAYSMIHALTSQATGFLKNGPVVGIDDDAEIHPDLMQLIWKVKKVGLWPMGNLGPTGWEGPVYDGDGQIVEWSASNTFRKYPIDNGAFAINSTLIGSQLLPGPTFWPTDLNGGESEFMERIVESSAEIEMLCRDCHVAWHNHPLGIGHEEDMAYESGGPWT